MQSEIECLRAVRNPLPWQILFYLPDSASHLDLGSNRGATLRGLPTESLTCVEKDPDAADTLRASGYRVDETDARAAVRQALVGGSRFDRVTAFDFIEHLERDAAEKLLGQVEQLARREVVLFVPAETDDPRCQEHMSAAMAKVPADQRELQTHRSRWTPEWFTQRGYLTLLLPDFHCPGFSAFFAAKYRRPEDRATIEARLREAFAPPATYRIDRPIAVLHPERMTLGDGVSVGYGARIECVTEHGGQTYAPRLVIGDLTTAEMFLHIGVAGKVVIGRDCVIAGHCLITDHEHGYDPSRPLHGQPLSVEPVEIGNSVFLGEGVAVLKGSKIGDHCVIGAHSVVAGDIPAYSVAVGAPARVIRRRRLLRIPQLVSVVIPTVDATSDRLARCLASIAANTPDLHEIIIVENGSKCSAADWHLPQLGKHFIRSEHKGFAAACNQGIVTARGSMVCLLNDDTIVTDGWLSKMLAVMHHFPSVGLVGPMSDNVSGPQCGEPADGPVSTEVSRLVGFAILVRRGVIDKIGGLDESFGVGNYEDDDLCLRARAAGFGLRIARDAFVRHVGGATFKEQGIDYSAAMQHGWQRFVAKWGAVRSGSGYRVEVPEWSEERCYVAIGEVAKV